MNTFRLTRHWIMASVAGLLAATLAVVWLTLSAPDSEARVAPLTPEYEITLDMRECGIMAEGVTGTCIISLQTWLNIFDKAKLKVDGYFGPMTERAVKHFQAAHGLDADGRFGEFSRSALRGEYNDMRANSVPTPRPGPKIEEAPLPNYQDPGRVEPGINGGFGYTVVTALACGGASLIAGAFTSGVGAFAVGVACDVVTAEL